MRGPLAPLACLALLATAACGAGQEDDGGDGAVGAVLVGYIAPLTGDYSALGTDGHRAVELAVAEVNAAGGVLGREIELITRDDRSSPDQSVQAFNDIIDRDPVAVIGSTVSDSAMATLPSVEMSGIPYLSPTPADEQLTPVRDNVFVVTSTTSAYARRALEYFQDTGVTRVSVAYSATSYAIAGFLAMEDMAEEHGVELVAAHEYEHATADFHDVIAAVEDDAPDAFFFWGTGAPGVAFAQQYAAVGADVPLVMSGAQASGLWLEPVGEAAEGVTVLSSISVVGEHLPDGEQRVVSTAAAEAFAEEHGYSPPQFAGDGYTAVTLLVAAIEKAGSTEHTSVRTALEGLDLTTPIGPVAYAPNDHAGLTTDAISVNTVEDGAFVPVPSAVARFEEAYGGRS
ncbi:ABC transporter substrate-binding protein [Nocardiopsis sp. NPDC050513]|uniref:ABC transporter substrate-binding protein n=1 Tax=Nocardiopsis sp. NPDC050513 TaxID=3364338 RepID=UPI0037AF44AB